MTEREGEAPPLPSVDEYLAHMHELVPGWFDDVDAAVFRAVDHTHRATGVDGDLLEIGAYLGKSAILLGYLLRAAELAGEGLQRSFRIAHVDGSHRYDIAHQDIATALGLVVDGGIVIVDDYRTVPHALGVAAAVWKAVTDGKLIPVLATVQKLYGCAPGGSDASASTLRRWALEEAPFGGLRQQVADHDMVVFAPPMGSPTLATAEPSREAEHRLRRAEEDAARLQARLALIEGSRTWRLRNRLMRLIGRGRTIKPTATE